LFAKTVIIIAGPTAVGKTALALQLAQHFKTAIISADSRQCFKEISIGTAKPTTEELAAIPHYFINTHSIFDTVNAGIFEQYALQTCSKILENNQVVIMVGGTGLYIKAFVEGIDAMPEIPIEIREKIVAQYQEKGLLWLQENVQSKDPVFWENAEQQNPQRLLRALEVMEYSGQSITQFRLKQTKERPFNIIQIGLEKPRDLLVQHIHERVDIMIKMGLVEEVASLVVHQQLNALQTVGYQEIFAYLNKEISLPQAIEKIKINTRQYAKRQMTWFKKQPNIQWFQQQTSTITEVLDFLHHSNK